MTGSRSAGHHGRKLEYVCQICGFASRPDGEWNLEAAVTGTVLYRCPECDHAVLVDPVFSNSADLVE